MKTILIRFPAGSRDAEEYARMLQLEWQDRGCPTDLGPLTDTAGEPGIGIAAAVVVCDAPDASVIASAAALTGHGAPVFCCAAEFPLPLAEGLIPVERPLDVRLFCDRIAVAADPSPSAPALRGLVIDRPHGSVTCRGEPIRLTKREFELLCYLASHRGRPVSREEAIRNVWEFGYTGDTNVVDVYIRYLRKKIDERFGTRYLITVRGQGYLLKSEENGL